MIGGRWSGAALAAALLAGSAWAGSPRAPGPVDRLQESPSESNVAYDGRFTFVRISFESGLRRGGEFFRGGRGQPPWAHDYPRAERNFMKILRETTTLTPYMDGGNILAADDPELFKYPVAYIVEVGYWSPGEEEVRSLRAYLEKGGFLIVDDFRGGDRMNFEHQVRRILPGAELRPLDVSHPVFHSFFDIESLDLAPPNFRQFQPEYLGVFEDNDPDGRLMMVANYNNDIGDYWEWSDRGFIPIDLSNEAYKLGVNYVVYALTH